MLSCETKNLAGGFDDEDDEEVFEETTVSSWLLMDAWVEAESEVNPTVELGEATLSICPYLTLSHERRFEERWRRFNSHSSKTQGGSVRVVSSSSSMCSGGMQDRLNQRVDAGERLAYLVLTDDVFGGRSFRHFWEVKIPCMINLKICDNQRR